MSQPTERTETLRTSRNADQILNQAVRRSLEVVAIAVRIADGNAAVGALVRGIEALGASTLADDDPALDWVADWQRLAAARAVHADRLGESATGLFQIPPTGDGYPITQRMIDVSPPECKLAVALASQP